VNPKEALANMRNSEKKLKTPTCKDKKGCGLING